MVSHIFAVLHWELISVCVVCQIPTVWMKAKKTVKRLSLQPCLLFAFIALERWRVNCVLVRFQSNIAVVYMFYDLLLTEENKNLCKQVISPTCTPVKINTGSAQTIAPSLHLPALLQVLSLPHRLPILFSALCPCR